jgi:hypothetical protein
MILRNDVVLYHGSYTIVRHPDLSKCRGEKDFGRGFYLTTSHEQAQRFVKSSVRAQWRRRSNFPCHSD